MIRLFAAISEVDNSLHIIWQDAYIAGDVYYSRVPLSKADDARAWQSPDLLIEDVDSAQLVIDQIGVIHIVFGKSTNNGLDNILYYLHSQDNGESWSDPQIIFSNIATLPSTISGGIAVDDAGRIHVGVTIRTQEYGVFSEVGYIRSVDKGQTWSSYRQIMVNGTTFQGVSTIRPYAFGADEIHLTWHDPRRMHQWSYDGGETWSNPVEIMPLGAAFGGPNHLVKDSANNLHAILATGGGVFSATWAGNRWGAYQQIDTRSLDPHGQYMVACQGNQLHAIYYDRTGDNKVWYSKQTVAAPPIPRQTQAAIEAMAPTPLSTSAAPIETTQPLQRSDMLAALNTNPQPQPSLHPLAVAITLTLGLLAAVVIHFAQQKK